MCEADIAWRCETSRDKNGVSPLFATVWGHRPEGWSVGWVQEDFPRWSRLTSTT
jgi:hypothetical protein